MTKRSVKKTKQQKPLKYGRSVKTREYEHERGIGMTVEAICEVAGEDPTNGKPYQIFRVTRDVTYEEYAAKPPVKLYKMRVEALTVLAEMLRVWLEDARARAKGVKP